MNIRISTLEIRCVVAHQSIFQSGRCPDSTTHTEYLTQNTPTNSQYIAFPVQRAHRVVVYTPSRAYTFPTYIFIYIRNLQRKCIRTTLAIYSYTHIRYMGIYTWCTSKRRLHIPVCSFLRNTVFRDLLFSMTSAIPTHTAGLLQNYHQTNPTDAHTHRHFPQILFCFMLRVPRPCCSFFRNRCRSHRQLRSSAIRFFSSFDQICSPQPQCFCYLDKATSIGPCTIPTHIASVQHYTFAENTRRYYGRLHHHTSENTVWSHTLRLV